MLLTSLLQVALLHHFFRLGERRKLAGYHPYFFRLGELPPPPPPLENILAFRRPLATTLLRWKVSLGSSMFLMRVVHSWVGVGVGGRAGVRGRPLLEVVRVRVRVRG